MKPHCLGDLDPGLYSRSSITCIRAEIDERDDMKPHCLGDLDLGLYSSLLSPVIGLRQMSVMT